MNIQNLRYALEIDRKKSISRAAKSLYVAQPNLSKSIKELEANCGIKIFKRSSRGVEATKEGQQFLAEAEAIIYKLDELQRKYTSEEAKGTELKISIPRACYIAQAFTRYMAGKGQEEKLMVHLDETGTVNAVKQVEEQVSSIGIIRYNVRFEEYFQSLFQLKDLESIRLLDFTYQLLVSENNVLTKKSGIGYEDLRECVEIFSGDNTLPNGEYADVSGGTGKLVMNKRVYVYDRQSQFDLLRSVENSFMWVAPIPALLLEQNGLKMITCGFMKKDMRDVIVCRKGHKYSTEEKKFLKEIKKVIAETALE